MINANASPHHRPLYQDAKATGIKKEIGNWMNGPEK